MYESAHGRWLVAQRLSGQWKKRLMGHRDDRFYPLIIQRGCELQSQEAGAFKMIDARPGERHLAKRAKGRKGPTRRRLRAAERETRINIVPIGNE